MIVAASCLLFCILSINPLAFATGRARKRCYSKSKEMELFKVAQTAYISCVSLNDGRCRTKD